VGRYKRYAQYWPTESPSNYHIQLGGVSDDPLQIIRIYNLIQKIVEYVLIEFVPDSGADLQTY